MELGLRDKVVIVTGASSGIGRATALTFAEERARLVATYAKNRAAAEETVARARATGAEAMAVRLDQADAGSVADLVATTVDRWGRVDVLVNNAVAWPPFAPPGELFETAPPERFAQATRANLEGPYRLSRAVVGFMREAGWGRIVHVSTGLVEDGFGGNVSYVAPKSGLHGLARVMSRELAPAGILTNVVMAGFTPADKEWPPEVLRQASAAAAIRRVSTPEETARVIVFLCSRANTNITGERIRADGHFLTPA